MSKRTGTPDPRWAGVQVASLWAVVDRASDPEEDRAVLRNKAWSKMKKGGTWRTWRAVYHPNGLGQVTGFRKVDPKEWFRKGPEGTPVEGPYPTKKLVLASIREKSARKTATGIYTAGGYTIFTRDRAQTVLGEEIEDR